jgi:hypothetical protein
MTFITRQCSLLSVLYGVGEGVSHAVTLSHRCGPRCGTCQCSIDRAWVRLEYGPVVEYKGRGCRHNAADDSGVLVYTCSHI